MNDKEKDTTGYVARQKRRKNRGEKRNKRMRDRKRLANLQAEAWYIAEEKGFHTNRSRAKVLALIHSEVSEALEVDRKFNIKNNLFESRYAEELADIVIRVLDHAENEDIDLETAILLKMEKNRAREHKHGKEY